MNTEIYLPVILQGQAVPYTLGCQFEGGVGPYAQWIIPKRQWQIGIKWRDVVSYGWGIYDADFAALSGHRITAGIKVVPAYARLWADYIASPPAAYYYNDLAVFINSLLSHCNDIEAIELFNEPDVDRDGTKPWAEYFGAWCVDNGWYNGGKMYGQMTKAVYPIVKAAHPNVRIIGGALIGGNPSSLSFLSGAIDGGLKCDALSFHKYIGLNGNFNAAFEFGSLLRNMSALPQILSETSITADVDSDALRQQQAAYLRHLRQNFGNSTVDVIQWYAMNSGWQNNDLINHGIPTLAYNEFIS